MITSANFIGSTPSSYFCKIVQMCWSVIPEKRPDASQLLAMMGASYEGTRRPGDLCAASPKVNCESDAKAQVFIFSRPSVDNHDRQRSEWVPLT
jgi:hypothetical protein